MNIHQLNSLLLPQGYFVEKIKNQEVSQSYEWEYCKSELDNIDLVGEYFTFVERQDGVRNFIFNEFCCKNGFLFDQTICHVRDKVVLEVGSSWVPIIPILPARRHIYIEPLADKIDDYVLGKYGRSIFSN